MPTPAFYGNFSDDDQPTLGKVQDLISDARTLLQDIVGTGYRYTDASLLVALNISLAEASRMRADLFVWNLRMRGQVPAFQAVDDTKVGLPVQFRLAMLHGICGHAMERDQEDYADSRATTFLNMFNQGLVGRNLGPVVGGAGPGGGGRGRPG